MFTFVAVVAVPVTLPVTFPVNVPKKLVAVAAVPVKFPENTDAASTLDAGLYVSSVSAEVANPLPEDAGENVMK